MNIEEFVNDYLKEHRHDVLLSPYNGLVDFAEAMKEETLKDSVKCTVQRTPLNGPLGIQAFCSNANPDNQFYNCKEGDKVRVIILKEGSQA